MGNSVRYGIISTAQIAKNQHVPAAAESQLSEVVAIASRSGERAKRAAEELSIPRHYGSYEDLLGDPEVEAVINALPNAMHCDWTIRAAEAGKHVLCEKPMAMTTDQCRRMIDACEANGVLLYEAFTQHFTPLMSRIHEIVDSGEIGEIGMIKAELTYTISDWKNDVRVIEELGGGALFDAGCYCVNTVRAIMGDEPIEATAFQRIKKPNNTDCTFAGLLKFPGDRIAYVATSQEQPFRWPLEVIGTDGILHTDNVFSAQSLTVSVGGSERTEEFSPVNRFSKQIDHFSRAIRGEGELRVSAADATCNTAALVALKKAAESGSTPVEAV